MRARLVFALVLVGISLPRLAHPQEFALGGDAGYFKFTQATNSTKAVFGSSGGATFGGDFRVSLGTNFFLRAGVRYFKKTGQRVFVADATSPVFPLKNEPLSAKVLPVEVTIGYRFRPRTSIVPYLGLGGGFAKYDEQSTVGGVASSLSETKAQGHILGGVEFGQGELRFGIELNYSTVPSAIGIAGVSQIYNEKDIGGLAILGRIVFTSPRH